MLHFFRAGPELLRWELTEVGRNGACRLAVHHSQGIIVEYFQTAAMAITRVQELEELLVGAQGLDDLATSGSPS